MMKKKTSLLLAVTIISGGTFLSANQALATNAATPSATNALNYSTAVMPEQLQRILEDIAKNASNADNAKDANALQARFTGPALDMRKGNYAVRTGLESYRASAAIGSSSVMAQVMGKAGESFPRKMIVVSKADNQLVPQALLLKQDSARDNYKVNQVAQLLPGSSFPQPLDLNYTAEMVAPDTGGFKEKPQDILNAYADLLNNSGEGNFKDAFNDNQYTQQVKDFQNNTAKNIQDAQGTVQFAHNVQADQTTVMKTAKGSALVFGYYVDTITLSPQTGDAGSGTINLPAEWKALAGVDSSTTPVTVTYGESVLFELPAAGSQDKITVIGADQDLLGVQVSAG